VHRCEVGGDAPAGGLSRRRIAALAALSAVFGWGLMTLGAFVRASGSGLACPDWPSCHGRLVAGGSHPLIEELHRWLATALVIAVIVVVAWIVGKHRGERRLIVPAVAALALMAVQVALGAVTVLLRNVSWTVVLHYGAAALLIASIVLVAVRLEFAGAEPSPRDAFLHLVTWFVALSFGLLLVGSTVANTDSHAACGHDALLCNGSLIPGFEHRPIINFTHRVWALAMVCMAAWVARRAYRDRRQVRSIPGVASAVAVLYVAQAAAGVVVMGLGDSVTLDVVHSSLASLTWLGLSLLFALTVTLAVPEPADATPSEPSKIASPRT
jgi:heme a synthase